MLDPENSMRCPGTGTTFDSVMPSPQPTLTLPQVPVPPSTNLSVLSIPGDSPSPRLTLCRRLTCGQPASTTAINTNDTAKPIRLNEIDGFTFHLVCVVTEGFRTAWELTSLIAAAPRSRSP